MEKVYLETMKIFIKLINRSYHNLEYSSFLVHFILVHQINCSIKDVIFYESLIRESGNLNLLFFLEIFTVLLNGLLNFTLKYN